MACGAKRNQILSRIITGLAPKLFVMNFEIGHLRHMIDISSGRGSAPGCEVGRMSLDASAEEQASVDHS